MHLIDVGSQVLKEIKAWLFFNFPQKVGGGLNFED